MDKILVSIFVLCLNEEYDTYLPINENMETVIKSVQDTLVELSNGSYKVNANAVMYDGITGRVINKKNIVKFSGLKNDSRVLLI